MPAKKPVTTPTLPLSVMSDFDMAGLVAHHGLMPLDVPEVNPGIPASENPQTLARWFAHLKGEGYRVTLFVDSGGKRWVALRDRGGVLQVGKVEGFIRQMQLNATAGKQYGAGQSPADRRARLSDWIQKRTAKIPSPSKDS